MSQIPASLISSPVLEVDVLYSKVVPSAKCTVLDLRGFGVGTAGTAGGVAGGTGPTLFGKSKGVSKELSPSSRCFLKGESFFCLFLPAGAS